MKELDVTGCRDLAAQPTDTDQPQGINTLLKCDKRGLSKIMDLLMLLRLGARYSSGCSTSGNIGSSSTELVRHIFPPAQEADANEWKPPNFSKLAVGWGFDGASIRTLLACSTDSLISLEVRKL